MLHPISRPLVMVAFAIAGCGGAPPAPERAPVVTAASGAPLASMGAEDADERDGSLAKTDKAAECNALIERINKAIDGLNNTANAPPNASLTYDYEVMANTMDLAADEIAKLKLQDNRLNDYSRQYQAMARKVATSARDLIVAFEARDFDKVNAAKEDVTTAVKEEDPIVDGINKYCHAP